MVAIVLWIIATPYLVYLSFKNKYKDSIPARFFPINNRKFEPKDVWFHTVSLGETMALKPLIELMKTSFNISTTTNTGYEYAKSLTKNPKFLPYEIFLPFWIAQHKTVVVLEAELWYMLFFMAKLRGSKTVLLNARISDRSVKSYNRFSFLYKKVFKNIDIVFAQTATDKTRLEYLGAKNIHVIGNIKLASTPKVTKKLIKPEAKVFTAASTHEDEERLVLDAWDTSMGKLIIAPRHPERFLEVEALIKSYGISYHKWSEGEHFNTQITLIDTIGELINIYNITDTVILGGAFSPIGGHNPLEPAYFNCAIISGENYFNQYETYDSVENIVVIKEENLQEALKAQNKPTHIKNKIDLNVVLQEIEN